MLKRPVVIITIGYIIGILMGLYYNISIALMYFILLIIYLIFKIYKSKIKNNNTKSKKLKLFSIKRYLRYIKIVITKNTIILFCISSCISNLIVINLNNKYNNLYNGINEQVEILGIVCSNKEEKKYKNKYKIKVEEINGVNRYKNTYLILNISKNIKLEYGDKIYISGEFIKPTTQRNYKGFNYKEYLKTIKVYGTINSKYAKVIKKNSLNIVFMKANDIFLKIKNSIESLYSKEISSILLGIMLGYTDNIDKDIKEAFSNCNVSHILAVSGMHISYIIIGISLLLNKYVGRRKVKIITILVLIIYMFITGFSPSIVRSSTMSILVLMSFIIYRKNDIYTSISISILIILIYNPFIIKDIGFILSYSGTLGIIFFQKNCKILLDKIKFKSYKNKYNKKTKFIKLKEYIQDIISVMISAQIVLIPFIIVFFNKVGILFIFINILVTLIVGPIVILGFIQIIISLICIKLGKIVSFILNPLIHILNLIVNAGDNISFNKSYFTTPDTYKIVIYYISILFLNYILKIYFLRKLNYTQIRIKNIIQVIKYKIRLNKGILKKYVIVFIFIVIIFNIIPKELEVHFIDVGQGDSTLIITPKNKSILIDGGGNINSEFDVGKQVLLPYLLDRKIKNIDYIIISHFDEDHVRTDYFIL